MRIAINGLGRVGRALLRQAVLSEDLDVVAVNDLADPHLLAALLRRDTTYGPFPFEVDAGDDCLVIDGQKVPWSDAATPAELPWASYAVDVAVECTGRFRTAATAGGHLEAGARKVVISAPGKDVDATIVMGINDADYDPSQHDVVSNASCTTNCVAPMVSVLHQAFGMQQGFMTTVHAYTGDQNLLDGPHKDLRRARSAAVNIIPTTTGAARAVGLVLPELAGKLDGVALRVPVVDGSLVDLAVLLDREVTVDEVNAAFDAASRSEELGGRLRYETEPIVSSDVIGDSASCVFDSELTQASGRFVKVFGWYDNEWGYTCRLAELVRLVGDSVTIHEQAR
jgi:glyceraldehyde 3-phosphate dehydrogenase